MHDYWWEFAKVAAAHALAVISPGPDFAIVLRQSITFGRRVGIWTSIGVGTAILLHVSYSLLGFGLIIRASPVWFGVFRYVGAAYIGWLGLQCLRAKRGTSFPDGGAISAQTPTSGGAFRTGFLTNALNPKVTLFFVTLFVTVINPATPKLIQVGYGAWMSIGTMLWFCLVALIFTRSQVRSAFEQYAHFINRALGLVLLVFAIGLAFARWE
ncbi:MAG: LysE family transporter [Opitutus sp.]